MFQKVKYKFLGHVLHFSGQGGVLVLTMGKQIVVMKH